ncbi:aldose epimerase family protein [Massilimicrobiota timonensis]|jgi:aldose 1-epimerase|uniref:aldose epimerase family protein n=1 Tax=Massilimicrobiota timonensis TaxID=1776392 RepID=UPI00101B952D|nr:aldose epimerase family protein [Massilimicrobiota timonensis]HJA52874.1 galactose mutarotase [Candidatus Massilimicrobiota merdigallinarum]
MIEVIKHIDDQIDLISMKNEQLEVVVSNYGCTIIKVIMADKNGHKDDVVLGYDDFTQYQTLDAYLGALVGRVANRIKAGQFRLNGQDYHLAVNNGPNHLHGGIKGFSYQVFDYTIEDEHTLKLHYLSKDGEEGYPGDLDLTVIYTLKDDTLTAHYQATSSADTLINITNHSYFNLSGHKENIYQHTLQIHASQFACVDSDGLTTGELKDVEGTPFDFRQPALIGERVEQDDEQLKIGKGFDHPFLFDTQSNQVILTHEPTGRQLIVSTTLPQAQIYTANYLDGRLGKYGERYYARDAVCIETQNMPDAIHLEEHPTTLLKKGETYDEITSYQFKVIQ